MNAATATILAYHYPDDQRYSLLHVTGDEDRHRRRVSDVRADDDLEYRTEGEEEVEGTTAYLIYTNDAPESALPDIDTETGLVEWLQEHFDEDDLQIVLAVYRAYRGILEERAELGNDLELFKQIQMEKIPTIVQRVQWGRPVPHRGC